MQVPTVCRWIAACAVLAVAPLSLGQSPPAEVLSLDAAWSQDTAKPGATLWLAVVVQMAPGWHVNADEGQVRQYEFFKAIPTKLTVRSADPSLQAGAARYPPAHGITVGFTDKPLMVFEERAVLYAPVTVVGDAAPGERTVTIELYHLACDDKTCLQPTTATLETTLRIAAADEAVAATHAELFADLEKVASQPPVSFSVLGWNFQVNAATAVGLGLLLLLAMLGGFLLNFTPCVLPVIPIKIIGLSQAAGHRGRCFLLGLAMSAGVVLFWLVLGGVIASATEFTAANQLFQYPTFTITMGVLIAAMALGMCGLFAVRLPRFVYMVNPRHDTVGGSVGFGVMTAVLSTPCTAPFMGSVAGWAATQEALVTMTAFAAIGVGMALPYLILAANPRLVDKMPRTGPGSELLKQVMGLLMLAAAAYFVAVGLVTLFTPADESPTKLYWWAPMAFIIAAGVWLAVRTLNITRRPAWRVGLALLAVVLVSSSVALGVNLTRPDPIDWIRYSPQRFQEELAQGRAVMMDFTAEWCLNCKALEHAVLYDRRVIAALQAGNVSPIKVDITSRANLAGQAMLEKVGSVTIPLLVVFAPDGSQVFKSDAYTAAEVVAAIEQAAGPRVLSAEGQ